MTRVDLIVANASELLTMIGPDGETAGPRRGEALRHLGIVADGAVAVADGKVVEVGPTSDILASFEAATLLDARGAVVMPGFVDTHTHLAWAGSRAWELEWKLQGRTYREITAAGGGIPYTVRATRAADPEALARIAADRAREALHHGTTTLEAKSGYGLSEVSELAQLDALRMASKGMHQRLFATYLGAHERPLPGDPDAEAYLNEMRESTLPKVAKRGLATSCDAFIEAGVWSPDEVRPLLAAAKGLGLRLRLHVDEFTDLGGAAFAVEMGAVSADHLLAVSPDGIEALAGSDTVATLLPLVPYALRQPRYAPARQMVEEGCVVAIASDHNPNVPCLNMGFVVQQAVYGMGLAPAEALVAATVNAGWSLVPELGLGVLAPGHPADLIITDAPDHVHLAYAFGRGHVRHVVVGGKVVGRA